MLVWLTKIFQGTNPAAFNFNMHIRGLQKNDIFLVQNTLKWGDSDCSHYSLMLYEFSGRKHCGDHFDLDQLNYSKQWAVLLGNSVSLSLSLSGRKPSIPLSHRLGL